MNAQSVSGDENGYPQLDLRGKLIIKVQFGQDIRRIPIHNEDITYDELVLMMQRVFRGSITNSDDIVVKYKDEDGDLITIFDSSDLAFAIQCSRILKLTLIVNGQPKSLETDEVARLRKGLRQIRDNVNQLLDSLDHELCKDKDVLSAREVIKAEANHVDQPMPIDSVTPKEFDPLQQVSANSPNIQKMATSASQEDTSLRGGTPDSVSSQSSRQNMPVTPQHSGHSTPSQPPVYQPVTTGVGPGAASQFPRGPPQLPHHPQSLPGQQSYQHTRPTVYAAAQSPQPQQPGLHQQAQQPLTQSLAHPTPNVTSQQQPPFGMQPSLTTQQYPVGFTPGFPNPHVSNPYSRGPGQQYVRPMQGYPPPQSYQ